MIKPNAIAAALPESKAGTPRSALRRWLRRVGWFFLFLLLLLLLAALVATIDGWTAFGKGAEGAQLQRMQRSSQWVEGIFVNPEPMWNDWAGAMTAWMEMSPAASPDGPLPVVRGQGQRFETPPASGLRITWLGHSTILMEIDGHSVLTDPIWGERSSPLTWVGPRRWYPPPLPLSALPKLDAVLISHDHFDHLNHPTIVMMKDRVTRWVVPLGVGAHLAYWGVPQARITECDWWQRITVGQLEVVCTPARHASGRSPFAQNSTLWAGFALLGPKHRVYYSGDTGLFPAIKEIGQKLGPFDVTMIEVGAYNKAWPDWHIGPEQAVKAHRWARGAVFLPVHWGMWNLASHGWTEPVERVLVAAEKAKVKVAIPRPGESIEPARLPKLKRWWPKLPWQTAQEHPIVSTRVP